MMEPTGELPAALLQKLLQEQPTLDDARRARAEVLRRSLWVPRPLEEVFAFFAAPENLELITPPWLRFRIQTPLPITMGIGTLIDYRIGLHGVPMRWRTRISAWQPPHRFADEQLRGPYSTWWHEHMFHAHEGGTEILDRIHFRAPLALIAHPLMVRGELARIFDYRHQVIGQRFGAPRS
jgi:ligand-binding SRPBCC domain-containing protein